MAFWSFFLHFRFLSRHNGLHQVDARLVLTPFACSSAIFSRRHRSVSVSVYRLRNGRKKVACKEVACEEVACRECKEVECKEVACKECKEVACKEVACEEVACEEVACKECKEVECKEVACKEVACKEVIVSPFNAWVWNNHTLLTIFIYHNTYFYCLQKLCSTDEYKLIWTSYVAAWNLA